MKNLKELRAMLASTLFNFKEQELPNGDVLLYDGEDLVEGMEVKVSAPNGEPVPAEGTYTVDNKEIVIEGGIVKTITEIKKEDDPKDAPVELEEVEEVIEDKVEDKQDFSEVLAMIEMLTKRVAELETALAGTTETVTKLSKVEMAEPIKKNPIQLEKTEKGAQTAMKYFQ